MAKMPGLNMNIKLDGEAEFRAALKDMDAGLRVLDSELAKTKAAYLGQADSIDALTAKQDVLTRKLYSQQEKTEKLREILKQAVEVYGEADQRTMKWQTELNKAEEAENRLNYEIKRCTEAMQAQTGDVKQLGDATEQSARQTTGLGDAVGSAASKLGINLPQGATNTLNSLGSLNAGAAAALGGFAALAAGIVKVEKALISLTQQNAEAADELETLSKTSGLSVKTLQEFGYAAEFVDVDVSTVTGSLTKLTRAMDSARDGSAKTQQAFDALGVTVTGSDGQLRSAEDVFYDVVDALGQVQNATERDALAMDLFGRSAQDLNPLILAGSAELKNLAKQANDTGYVLSDFAVKKLTAVDDSFQRLEKSRETLTKKLAVEFAPTAEKVFDKLATFVDGLGDTLVKSGAVDAFGDILESLVGMLPALTSIATTALPMVAKALQPVAKLVAGLADAWDFFRGIFPQNWGQGLWAKALGWNIYNPSNLQQYDTYSTFGLTWNSNDLHWEDSSGNIYYATETGPSAVGSPSFRTTQEKYEDWVAAGGADGNGNGSYEWWYNYVYGRNAAGTDNWRGGATWVGENGPEIVYLPQHAQITSASESRELGGDTFYVTINARDVQEFNDIVRIAKEARMKRRKAVSG